MVYMTVWETYYSNEKEIKDVDKLGTKTNCVNFIPWIHWLRFSHHRKHIYFASLKY